MCIRDRFVGHGLGAVNYVSDRIAVMYLGKIVELGKAEEVFHSPVHPYTKALINACLLYTSRTGGPDTAGGAGSVPGFPAGLSYESVSYTHLQDEIGRHGADDGGHAG